MSGCRSVVSADGWMESWVGAVVWGRLRLLICVGVFCLSVFGCLAGVSAGGYQGGEAPQLTRFFPLGARRGATTEVQVKGKYQGDSVSLWSHVPGLSWVKLEGDDQFAVTIDAGVEVGVVWVRLVDAGGASEVLPFVVSDWAEVNEVEPNDRSDAAQAVVELPVVINGVLQRGGDVDHYRISLERGQTLVAVVDAQRYLQSAVDATLQLVTTDGQILCQNMDYRGLDPQIVWTASQDIEVVLRVFGFPAAPDSTISLGGGERFIYRLSVTTGEAVEAVSPLAVQRGVTTQVTRHGWNLSDESRQVIEWGEDPREVRLVAGPMALGWFPLPIVEHASLLATEVRTLGTASGTRGDGVELPGLVPPMTITGNLAERRQVDRFMVEVPADKTWRIEVAARQLGYAWDPVLEVYSVSDGKRLHRQDDQGSDVDPVWNWTPPAAGQYWVQLFDLHGHAGAHQWYRLTMTELVPMVRLRTEGSVYRGRVGEPLEVKVTIERQHGYDLELELGLLDVEVPDGSGPVTCEVQRSSAADESGKQVVLRLLCAEPFQGPVRLWAREVSGAEGRHAIRANGTELSDLWLSILP